MVDELPRLMPLQALDSKDDLMNEPTGFTAYARHPSGKIVRILGALPVTC